MQPDPKQVRINETEARAGNTNGGLRWILTVSLALAIIALTVIWVTGALGSDDGAATVGTAPAATS